MTNRYNISAKLDSKQQGGEIDEKGKIVEGKAIIGASAYTMDKDLANKIFRDYKHIYGNAQIDVLEDKITEPLKVTTAIYRTKTNYSAFIM